MSFAGSTVIYTAKSGAGFTDDDAQIIGERAAALIEKLGMEDILCLSPHDVVDDARPEDSPLHPYFEWNDSTAAESWRLSQARNHINHLQVTYVDDGVKKTTKAFHSIRIDTDAGEQKRGYMTVWDAQNHPAAREQIIQNALHEQLRWRDKYSEYSELFGIVKAINAAEKKIVKEAV